MQLINCKVELSLTWDPNCVLSNLVGASTFTITDAKLYASVVTLSTKDNAKLSKLFSEGFERPVSWVNSVTADSHRRCSLPRVKVENYSIEIDGRIFFD